MEQTCQIPLNVVNAMKVMSYRIQKDIQAIATQDELNNPTSRYCSLRVANNAIMCALEHVLLSFEKAVDEKKNELGFENAKIDSVNGICPSQLTHHNGDRFYQGC